MVCRTHKYADGGKIRKRETSNMPPPEKGGTPKRIVATGPPGGPHTPGAKAARAAKKKKAKAKGYADGGKVAKKKSGKRKKAKPSMLGSGMAAQAGSALRDTRKKQMKDLGI